MESINCAKEEEEETNRIIQKYFRIADVETLKSFYIVYVGDGLNVDLRPTREMWEKLYCPAVQAGFTDWPGLEMLLDQEVIKALYE